MLALHPAEFASIAITGVIALALGGEMTVKANNKKTDKKPKTHNDLNLLNAIA
jgi:hypothetical protein